MYILYVNMFPWVVIVAEYEFVNVKFENHV